MKRTFLLYAIFVTLTGQQYEPTKQTAKSASLDIGTAELDALRYSGGQALFEIYGSSDLQRVPLESEDSRHTTELAF